MSDSLWPHELQHARLLCLPLLPGACSNSCPLSWWCSLTISLSTALFFCLQFFPESGSFPVSQLQLQPSVLPMNIHCWFPLELTGLTSLLSRVLSKVFFNSSIGKHQFFSAQPSLWSNSYIHSWVKENKKKPQ